MSGRARLRFTVHNPTDVALPTFLALRGISMRQRTANAQDVQRVPPTSRKGGRRFRPGFEVLEARDVPSTIVWDNEGDARDDSDGFNAAFGSSASLAREIVHRAISAWEEVIIDFNHSDGGN